ncbi:MAG: GWxTD domain-containing protein [Bacteroidia bacterium]
MRRRLSLLALLFVLTGITSGLAAKELMYYVDVCKFYDASGKPYVEVYLDVDAGSVSYAKAEDGGLQGLLEVRYAIRKKGGVGEEAIPYDKAFELWSPTVQDSSPANTTFGIMDVRRISLAPGEYEFTGFLKDKVQPNAHMHQFVFDVSIKEQPTGFASTSEIEFVQSVKPTTLQQAHSKLGFDILPLVTNGTYQDLDSLNFYVETYNSQLEASEVYFASAYITLAGNTSKIGKEYGLTFKHTSKPLDVLYGSFNIKNLPTQTYYLNVELYNKEQKLIENTSKKFFVVNTRMEIQTSMSAGAFDEVFKLDEEKLTYYIHSLYYISTNTERDFANALKTLDEKKNFFMNFWENRKGSSGNPIKAWTEYKARVDYANQHFKAAHLEGWRTDRGRILLTYGSPNDIERNPSSNSKHPYDVWRYNKIKTQANVRFIFYNPNEATADYVLLHSDLRGELNNPRWEFNLYRTANDANLDVDALKDEIR